jgi:hypothetical protein
MPFAFPAAFEMLPIAVSARVLMSFYTRLNGVYQRAALPHQVPMSTGSWLGSVPPLGHSGE